MATFDGAHEYGVTYSHSSVNAGGLVEGPFDSAWDAHNRGCDVREAQPGIDYAIVRRPVGSGRDAWASIDGSQTLAQVRARRWAA